MKDYALSTNLYTFAQAEKGFFAWPATSGEGEVIRSLEPGDAIVPKFSQGPEYSDDEANPKEYCESIGLDYDEIRAGYVSTVQQGQNVTPYLLQITGPPPEEAETAAWEHQAVVGVVKVPLAGEISTKDFLRLRFIPEEIAAQFKGMVSPGRHLQELPQGTSKAILQAAQGDLTPYLRKYSVVVAENAGEAESLLAQHGRSAEHGDRVFIATHAGLLGVHDVNAESHLVAVGEPILKTPHELLELFEEAKARINSSDYFTAKRPIEAAHELITLVTGPTDVIAIDDFSRFHDRYTLLARRATQAIEIANRPIPISVAPIPKGDEAEAEPDGEVEGDESEALAGLTVGAVRAQLPIDMVISDSVLAEAVTALRAGKHLLLGGPPGTGKSTLAHALCQAVVQQQFDVATATADWTTFDTIGGYIPHADGLRFEPGVVLRALKRGRWLVIDELNRADIDKAFGPLFTMLASSGDRGSGVRVVLPYLENGKQVELRWVEKRTGSSSTDYLVTPSWRLIGTLNLSDKATLFQLSFAFLRRFAVLDVPLPDAEGYRAFFEGRCPMFDSSIRTEIVDAVIALAFGQRQLGPAILADIAIFMTKGLSETAAGTPAYGDPVSAFLTAVRLFAVPQYEGATKSESKFLIDTVGEAISEIPPAAMKALEEALASVELS